MFYLLFSRKYNKNLRIHPINAKLFSKKPFYISKYHYLCEIKKNSLL